MQVKISKALVNHIVLTVGVTGLQLKPVVDQINEILGKDSKSILNVEKVLEAFKDPNKAFELLEQSSNEMCKVEVSKTDVTFTYNEEFIKSFTLVLSKFYVSLGSPILAMVKAFVEFQAVSQSYTKDCEELFKTIATPVK